MKADVVVIGGGPAGLMAAIAAAEHGAKVLLLDKGNKLGRKLAISGGGRCNVTNNQPIDELISNIPGNGRFMYSPFSVFNNEDIIDFFENLGISLKEEDRGRMFPQNDDAKSVVNALIGKMEQLSVQIRKNTKVMEILYHEQAVKGVKLETGEIINTNQVIVAVGGKSVPHTGSTGDGYPWAQKAGHTITELYPTEVPITLNNPFIKSRQLQGLSLQNVGLSVIDPKNKKTLVSHQGDMIFTHFGISGPISLRCSQFVVKALKKHAVSFVVMEIDIFLDKNKEELLLELESLLSDQPKRMLKNALSGWLPERLIPLLLELADTDPTIVNAELSNEKKKNIIRLLKHFPLHAVGTLPIEKAFVTGGGVSVKEIQPKKMESKLVQGLFFCGEILDIHGYTGGYNITVAFSTGYTAGRAAAMNLWK